MSAEAESSFTHVMLAPGTNHQRFRGQQEVRGQATDPMNSCFSATALFFDSFLPTPFNIFFPLLFSSPSPPDLPLPRSHRDDTARPISLCCSPPLHLLGCFSPSPSFELSSATFSLPHFLFILIFTNQIFSASAFTQSHREQPHFQVWGQIKY